MQQREKQKKETRENQMLAIEDMQELKKVKIEEKKKKA